MLILNGMASLWLVDYKEFYEGRTINAFDEQENHSLYYYTFRRALMNAFSSNTDYAFIILESYPYRLYLSVSFSFTKCLRYTPVPNDN